MNKATRKDNTSGKTGVYLDNKSGKWMAEIWEDKTRHRLGRHDDMKDAIDTREYAEAHIKKYESLEK